MFKVLIFFLDKNATWLHNTFMSKINDIISNSIFNSTIPVDYIYIAQDLRDSGLTPNKTTIYRNLDNLERQGVIQKVVLSDQKQYWEKLQNSPHYHFHLICKMCKKIECRELVKALDLGFRDFKIQKTDFNLFGLCNQCQ
jgi:Fe2+ or Zn2+ uptake regulation protein